MKVAVIGCGYLGATHAAAMAELGHEVLGVDVDPERVRVLAQGRAPFAEPGLDDLLVQHVGTGRLRFTTSFSEAAAFADLYFLCVGTPQKADHDDYDLTHLRSAARTLAKYMDRPSVVVGKSTVPVGTAARLAQEMRLVAPAGDGVEVAWNPEFLCESTAVEDALHPSRLVIGIEVGRPRAERVLREVYDHIIAEGTPTLVTDLMTAELSKLAANAFLATKISFINAMSELCEHTGADIVALARTLGHDTRIGPWGLRAGSGFGGSCLPKDLHGLLGQAESVGASRPVSLLRAVDEINSGSIAHVVELALEACGRAAHGKRITVWGAAFKPGTDDIRESPGLRVAEALHDLGAKITVSDPVALPNARLHHPHLDHCADPMLAADGADLVVHLTEWPEFAGVDPAVLAVRVNRQSIVDACGTLDPTTWRQAEWAYRAPGRPNAA
ncbi:UDP-glucose/GDP-mannose dehydrogenase family protein [Lentzea sp. NPDC051208]|uniref:UDP-glucose dehydrogenase family protein n=1 Tax=Lentzea sp. NPDC051208 TaxID=3154642 RepID=UPI00342B9540